MARDVGGMMTEVTQKCAMFGCHQQYYQSLAIAPATVVNLCFQHFVEEGGVVEEAEDNRELSPAGSADTAHHQE